MTPGPGVPADGPVTVLAVDPGRAKCGLAVVTAPSTVLWRGVVPTERLVVEAASALRRYAPVHRLLVGAGTHSAPLRRALQVAFPDVPLETVDEHGSSARARRRFVAENPARGWRRLLPPGMRSPERPYDDYVALLLAEEFFAARAAEGGSREDSPEKS